MVRPQNSGRPRKTQVKDNKVFNANGYAKRQTLKAKKSAGRGVSDVYEHHQEKERRGKMKMLLEKDEMLGAGRGGSDDEDDRRGPSGKGKPRLVGEFEDNMEIGEDEDEEIDSDGAFDESDEERYAGFGFASGQKPKAKASSKKTKATLVKGVRFAEVDLNEDSVEEEMPAEKEEVSSASEGEDGGSDEEEEEEGDANEFIDVLDIMDDRGEALSEDEGSSKVAKKAKIEEAPHSRVEEEEGDDALEDGADDDEEDEEGSEDGDEDEEDAVISASEDEDDNATSSFDSLQTFITSLDAGQKRKLPEDEDDVSNAPAAEARPQKRRLLQDRTESGVENEFATHIGATKLNLDDLLAPLASTSTSANLKSLKKSAKILTSTSSKHKTLSAPLPTRTQERLDREAAYDQTKEEVDKWSATMKRIKEAEHLSFPLQGPAFEKTSSLQLAAKFKPTTEMESAVDKLMAAANLRGEKDIAATESLKMNHLTVEEVAERRAELAKTRELMFRAEAKAKRVAKIKSKTYRRLQKRAKAKLAAKLGEGEDGVDEDDEEGRLKMETERAKERATLKHKNTGKWAQSMKHRGELNEDQRRDIAEMLDRGEKLRRRIRGEDSGEESGNGDDDDNSDEDDETIKARAFDELNALRQEDDSLSEGTSRSVFKMKFMKDAAARDAQRANQMVDDFVKELGGRGPDEDGDENAPDSAGPHGEAQIARIGGRVTYRPGALLGGLRPKHSLASDTSSVTLKSTDFLSDPAQPNSAVASPVSARSERILYTPAEEIPNPWLVPRSEDGAPDVRGIAVQRKHEVMVSKDSKGVEKARHKLRKKKQTLEEQKAKAKEDAAVDVEMADVITAAGASSKTACPSSSSTTATTAKEKKSAKGKGKASAASTPTAAASQVLDDDSDDSDANSELDEQEHNIDSKLKGKARAVRAFEQRDLVARAFAGDNVQLAFEETKRQEIQGDAPKEVDTTLPGWGSWGGTGTRKAPPKPHLLKKVAGVDPRSRADFAKPHVMISEKRDKKAAKYLVKDLPFPYTSKAQFERSMGMPLGTEWNTRVGFQRGTLPRVVTKPGVVISPLEKLL